MNIKAISICLMYSYSSRQVSKHRSGLEQRYDRRRKKNSPFHHVDFCAAEYDLCRYFGNAASRVLRAFGSNESATLRYCSSAFCCFDGGCDRDGSTLQNIESQSKSFDAFRGSSSVHFMGRSALSDAVPWRLYAAFVCVFRDRGSRNDVSNAVVYVEMACTRLNKKYDLQAATSNGRSTIIVAHFREYE